MNTKSTEFELVFFFLSIFQTELLITSNPGLHHKTFYLTGASASRLSLESSEHKQKIIAHRLLLKNTKPKVEKIHKHTTVRHSCDSFFLLASHLNQQQQQQVAPGMIEWNMYIYSVFWISEEKKITSEEHKADNDCAVSIE